MPCLVLLSAIIAALLLNSCILMSSSRLSASSSQEEQQQELFISDGLDTPDSGQRSIPAAVSGAPSCYMASSSVIHFVVLDAGSTGTRAVAHRFQRNDSSPLGLDHLGFTKHKRWPGLTAYRHFPVKCRRQLESLLAEVALAVPRESRSSTCLLLRATAGFRLIDARSRYLLAREIRGVLLRSEFATPSPPESVRMLDGSEEAKYTWLSVNYLLGNFRGGGSHPSGDGRRGERNTKPVIEMGGGSLQVAYESQDEDHQSLLLQAPPGSISAAGSKPIRLRAHSYLGLGIRESVLRFVGHQDDSSSSSRLPENDPARNSSGNNSGQRPTTYTTTCLAENLTLDFAFGLVKVKLAGTASPNPGRPECLARARDLVASLGVSPEPELNEPRSQPVFGISGVYHLLQFMHQTQATSPGSWNVSFARDLCPGRERCKAYASNVADVVKAASAVCRDVPADGPFKPFYCINLAVTAALLAAQPQVGGGGGGMGLRPDTRLVALGGQDSLGWSLGLSLDYLTTAMASANSGGPQPSATNGKLAAFVLATVLILLHTTSDI